MSGVCKEINFDLLEKKNEGLFVSSFYRSCSYMPDILSGNEKIISTCLDTVEAEKYLRDYSNNISRMSYSLINNSLEKIIKLDNNSVVYLKICKIGGLFLMTHKSNIQNYSSSDELPIDEISAINNIYIPLEIYFYEKPTNKELQQCR